MKKIVAFIGSPRKNGSTAIVVGEIVRGAQAAGAETKVYRLNELNIKPCQSCFHCQREAGCAIKDDMQPVYEDIKAADALVIGIPIYFGQASAQTKIFIDRLFSLLDASHKPRCGAKKVALVYAQGNKDPDLYKQYLDYNVQVLRRILQWDIGEPLLSYGANNPNTAAGKATLLPKAFETGKLLAASE